MNASLTIVYWRDIPAQVIARGAAGGRGGRGRGTARRVLSGRFQEAIDRAAMRAGLSGSDAYLEQWRQGEPDAGLVADGADAADGTEGVDAVDASGGTDGAAGGGDLEAAAETLARRLEEAFTDKVLTALVASGGRADPRP